MKTYYCVRLTFDDHGKKTAMIMMKVQADKCPKRVFYEADNMDVHLEWYDSYATAYEVMEDWQADVVYV